MKTLKKILLSIISIFSLTTVINDHVILQAAEEEEVDLIKPVINGPTSIVKSSKTLLTSLDIQSMLTAVDDVDGNITGKIKISADSFTGNGNIPGDYTISFKVSDKALNVSFHIVKITVNSEKDMKNCIYTNDGITSTILIEPTIKLVAKDFINVLILAKEISSTNYTEILVLEDQYSDFYDIEGIYVYILRIRSIDGTDEEYTFNIQVKENAFTDDIYKTGDLDNESNLIKAVKGTGYVVSYPFIFLYKCGYWLFNGKWPDVEWHEDLKWD